MVMIRIHASYGDKISPIGMHKSFQCLDTLGLLKMLLLLPLLLQSVSFPMKLLLLESLLQLLILTRPFAHPCPRQTLKTRPLILQLLVRVRIIHTH